MNRVVVEYLRNRKVPGFNRDGYYYYDEFPVIGPFPTMLKALQAIITICEDPSKGWTDESTRSSS